MWRLPYILLGVGFLLVAASMGISYGGLFPDFSSFHSQNPLAEPLTSSGFESHLKINIFEIVNPNQILGGFQPKLKENGPFIYKNYETRNISSKDPIEYSITKMYRFDTEQNNTENELLTIVNLPWIVLARDGSKLGAVARLLLIRILTHEQNAIFIKRSTKELFSTLENDPIVSQMAPMMPKELGKKNGFYLPMNSTPSPSISASSYVLKYGNKSFEDYEGFQMNFDGWMQFPPNLTEDFTFRIFPPGDFCIIPFKFGKIVQCKGIPAMRFVVDECCFIKGSACIRNRRPCEDVADGGVEWTLPHFYPAGTNSSIFSEMIPNRGKHQSYFDIEPVTGTLLQACKRVQLNIKFGPLKSVKFKKLPEITLPVLWTEEAYEIQEMNLQKLQFQLNLESIMEMAALAYLSSLILASIGLLLISISIFIFILRWKNKVYRI